MKIDPLPISSFVVLQEIILRCWVLSTVDPVPEEG